MNDNQPQPETAKGDNACIEGPLVNGVTLLEPLLTLEDVCKEFLMNDGTTFVALKNLSFTIKNIKDKPQIVSLLGPSGAGKTTALRLIAGLDAPTSGCVLITNGKGLRAVEIGDVGVVFQKYPLFEDLNVLNNLMVPALNAGMSKAAAKEKALHYLDEFDLVKQGLAWPVQLSGGQRQRVAILQQLMKERHFIILDEPFSGLDPVNIMNVIKLISRIANQHTLNTFIIITHDITSALAISNHIYLLGRERNEEGKAIPGSRVMKEYDLMQEGIAFHTNLAEAEDLPRFAEIRKEIKLIEFPKL
ncbi:MAG: ATP-binding cassette domain-containing protein [Acidobacteria bacterium]|nr:ATP-binding cassette domain-containing protein [Acidobacteriota bacterium]